MLFVPFPCSTRMGHIMDGSGRDRSPSSTGGAKSKSTAVSPSEANMRDVCCGPNCHTDTSLPVPLSTLNSRRQFLSLVSTTRWLSSGLPGYHRTRFTSVRCLLMKSLSCRSDVLPRKKRKSQISSSHSIVRLLREKHGDCDIFSSTRARFKNKETSIRHIMWDCILYCLGRHSPVNFIKKNYFVRVRTLKGIQWWLRNKIFKMKTFAES